jgi:hypothetical protein
MTTGLKSTSLEGNSFVYIRHLDDGEIRSLLPPEALVVASADGQRLAIVEGREAAFAAALANDLSPLSVH